MSAIAKGEYEKLPKIGSTTVTNNKSSNDCIVPYIENKSELFSNLQLKIGYGKII